MRLLAILAALALALPALAERPADVLAKLRGAPSTNAGALGSAFPQQYVDAYRDAYPPPVIVFAPRPSHLPTCGPHDSWSLRVDAGPVTLTGTHASGGGVSRVACPAPGWPTTIITTTTTTTITSSGGSLDGAPPPPAAPEPRIRRVTTLAPALPRP